jgi:hypothetical protein
MSGGNRSGLLFDSSSGVKKLSKRQAFASSKSKLQDTLKKVISNELNGFRISAEAIISQARAPAVHDQRLF